MGTPQQLVKLRQHAILLLTRREHAHFELTNKLLVKGYESSQIDQVLDQLEAEDLLSDRRFAECYIRSRASKGYGPCRINMELRERRVDEQIISDCLYHDWDWYEQAVEVRKKRFGIEAVTNLKDRVKQQRFLQYRGFSTEQISVAMRRND